MNTQLLRYNVLTEHLTFPPIPPATRDFGRTGRTHRLLRNSKLADIFRLYAHKKLPWGAVSCGGKLASARVGEIAADAV